MVPFISLLLSCAFYKGNVKAIKDGLPFATSVHRVRALILSSVISRHLEELWHCRRNIASLLESKGSHEGEPRGPAMTVSNRGHVALKQRE